MPKAWPKACNQDGWADYLFFYPNTSFHGPYSYSVGEEIVRNIVKYKLSWFLTVRRVRAHGIEVCVLAQIGHCIPFDVVQESAELGS